MKRRISEDETGDSKSFFAMWSSVLLLRAEMKYKAADIITLLNEIAREAGVTLQYASFGEIYSKIEEKIPDLPFSDRYLYKQVYQPLQKLQGKNDIIRLNSNNVEHLVKYLSYTNYDQFIKVQSQPVHPVLMDFENTNWYSYVRCNSGEEYVLVSPVRFIAEGREIFMHLKGPRRTFTGKLKFGGNCIYCDLESGQEKNLHLVFYTGFAKQPDVLQGVFSGMSTAGDPIAGREVLIRQPGKLSTLQNSRRPIGEMMSSKNEEEQAVGSYFKNPAQNILKAGKASTFGIDDLKIS